MREIQVLPADLAARIAAGEVVERPASIVKELVENSLDAGSRRVVVEVEAGGKRRIRVTDDGRGMDREDARLALERHATSKIRDIGDLQEISTLGFRGEALPSIAAVSRVRIRTSRPNSPTGVRLLVVGGKVTELSEVRSPGGTSVEVDSLFHSLPARQKFLRSIPTELSRVTDLLNRFALAYPEVAFRLSADGRILLEAPATDDRQDRIRQVFGVTFAKGMIPLDLERGYARLTGSISRPDSHFPNSSRQILFVNRRVVRDRSVSHAVQAAHRRCLPSGRYPAALVFLEIPPHAVDVNVHPAKTEIRFRDPSLIHDLVLDAIRQSFSSLRPFAPMVVEGSLDLPPREAGERLQEAAEAVLGGTREGGIPWGGQALPAGPADRDALPLQSELQGPPVHALAQYRDSFIVGCDAQGLLVVDQHAAHERVLYERYVAGLHQEAPERQPLLIPKTLDLTATQMVALESAQEHLLALGFHLEPFGKRGLIVREVPAIVDPGILPALLADLLDEAGKEFGRREPGRLQEQLAVTTACHAAIKIHRPLGQQRMNSLLLELFQTSQPMTCPHGRPVVLRIAHEELLARFRRR